MATGYDARQPGRSSFVTEGRQPVQTQTGLSGASQGSQLVGGQSVGGVVSAGMETNAGPIAGQLGQYFGELMRPQVERAQRARFFEGLTRAQAGETLEELTNNDSPLTRIFGPSGFEQGAQFYHAQAAVDRFTTEMLADEDLLKRMPPEELSRVIAERSQAALTGDEYADALVQQGLLEAQGPLVRQISTARFAWQQQEMVAAMSESGNAAATALQGIMVRAAAANPSADDTAAAQAQQARFIGMMAKPTGMTDEAYQGHLHRFMRRQLADGNFYAVEIMRRAGVDQVLTDEQRTAIENDYNRYSDRVLQRAMNSPDLLRRVMRLDARVESMRLDAVGPDHPDWIGADGVVGELMAINRELSAMTGVDKDYFDAEELRSEGKSVMGVLIGKQSRAEDRAYAEARQEAEWAREDAQIAEDAAAAQYAWASGDITGYLAEGGRESRVAALALNDYRAGNLGTIQNAYRQTGYVDRGVATLMQAQVASAIGQGFTAEAQEAYRTWTTLYQAQPAAAAAYFGTEYHAAFRSMHNLVTTRSSPEAAFRNAFSGSRAVRAPELGAAQARRLAGRDNTNRERLLDDANSWFPRMFGGRADMNGPGRNATYRAIETYIASQGVTNDAVMDDLAEEAVSVLTSNGHLERFGQLVVNNNGPTRDTIRNLLGVRNEAEGDAIVTSVVQRELARTGFRGDLDDNVEIERNGTGANTQLIVTGRYGGRRYLASITLPELRAERQARVGRAQGETPQAVGRRAIEAHRRNPLGTGPRY